MIDWDLDDYGDDPWGEWRPGARDLMKDSVTHAVIGEHEDKIPWDCGDEPRYLAALLAAGPEPEDCEHDAHGQWQERAAAVLMQKYRKDWWFNMPAPLRTNRKSKMDPKYRERAQTVRRDVQQDELTKFYTWLCNERREGWTRNLVPKGL